MYGHIHVILRDFVQANGGMLAWRRVLTEAGYTGRDDGPILDSVPHNDEVTVALFAATCKVLQMSIEKALRSYGNHFARFTLRSGNGAFLRTQGATFSCFLGNVNNLHNYFEREHPAARFPFVEATRDAKQSNMVRLSYLSVREGFRDFLLGILEEIGLRLYGVDVVCRQVDVPEELRPFAAAGRAACWEVSWVERHDGPVPLPEERQVQASDTSRRVSFSSLHTAMAEVARLSRRPRSALRLPCGGTQNAGDGHADGRVYEDTPSKALAEAAAKLLEVRHCPRNQPLELILLRAAPAREVAAAWSDPGLPRVRAFWSRPEGRAQDYALSRDAVEVDVFISHCWRPPEDWEEVMGRGISYADVKSNMVALMAKDVALGNGNISEWGDVAMWVDKACIPQDNPSLKEMCISLLEHFLRRSDKVCVIFTWSYLERLWCVYEWACIIVDKDVSQVYMQNELLVTETTLPLYLRAIRNFNLDSTKCFIKSDREILRAKIQKAYVTAEAFERMVQATAIALMARSMAFRSGRSEGLYSRFYLPWVDLASELGFDDLASALATCNALEWRGYNNVKEAVLTDLIDGVSARRYHDCIEEWFEAQVAPVLLRFRQLVEACN